uniref:Uncharacterized protein n=1 Tax=Anopheles atroparvus TaxID=41427 RepID=A0A182J1N8_ANOAO
MLLRALLCSVPFVWLLAAASSALKSAAGPFDILRPISGPHGPFTGPPPLMWLVGLLLRLLASSRPELLLLVLVVLSELTPLVVVAAAAAAIAAAAVEFMISSSNCASSSVSESKRLVDENRRSVGSFTWSLKYTSIRLKKGHSRRFGSSDILIA